MNRCIPLNGSDWLFKEFYGEDWRYLDFFERVLAQLKEVIIEK